MCFSSVAYSHGHVDFLVSSCPFSFQCDSGLIRLCGSRIMARVDFRAFLVFQQSKRDSVVSVAAEE